MPAPQGDLTEAGFAEWVRPNWDAMRRLASRMAGPDDCDDVLQESLLLAWRRFEQYRPERGSPRAWLLAIVANQARKMLRGRRPLAEMLDVGAAKVDERDLDLATAVARLPQRQRLAIDLHYYLGLSVLETAEVMGCAEGTVKATLSAARGRLARALKEDES